MALDLRARETRPARLSLVETTPAQPVAEASRLPWDTASRRVGFIGVGASLYSVALAVWSQGQITSHHEVVAMVMLLYAFAFLLVALGVAPDHLVRRVTPLILCGAVVGLSVFAYMKLQISLPTYQTDNAVFSHVAAEHVLAGDNPYAVQDRQLIEESAERFGLQTTFLTHTTDGEPLDRLMSWPAGSILPVVAFLQLGGGDVRWIVVAFQIAVMILLWFAAPVALRPLCLLPMLVDPDLYLNFTGGGVMDFFWVLPMMGAAIALYGRHLAWSALLFGLAAGTKQQPWLLAPFLAIYIWQMEEDRPIGDRVREVARFGAISAAAFLALNAPFIMWNPRSWAEGVLVPFSSQLVPFGSGLSMLTQTGIADLGRDFYTAGTVGVWAVLLLAYAVHFRTLRHALWLAPAIVMWFGYRGLQNYFIYWTPVLMVGVYAWWNEYVDRQCEEHAHESAASGQE